MNKEEIWKELESESWLFSRSLTKRALAAVGHYVLGYLILFIPLCILLVFLNALGI